MRISAEKLLQRYAAGERDFISAQVIGQLIEADLQGINLGGAIFDCNTLEGSNFSYAKISEAYISEHYLADVNFRDANLSRTSLEQADLQGAILCRANLRESKLRFANLRKADLTDADLTGADLYGADLRWANLTNVIGVELIDCALCNTVMPDGSIRNDQCI